MKSREEVAFREDQIERNSESQSPSYRKVPHDPLCLDLLGATFLLLLVLFLQVKPDLERDVLRLTHLKDLIVHVLIVVIENVDLILVEHTDISDPFDLISNTLSLSELGRLLEEEWDVSVSFDLLESGSSRLK